MNKKIVIRGRKRTKKNSKLRWANKSILPKKKKKTDTPLHYKTMLINIKIKVILSYTK